MTLRTHRRICWTVIVVASVYLVGWSAVELRGHVMAKSLKTLHAEAVQKFRDGDCKGACEICNVLEERKGGPVLAHALRGAIFESQNKLIEAEIQYTAAHDLGDEIAAGSCARVKRKREGVK